MPGLALFLSLPGSLYAHPSIHRSIHLFGQTFTEPPSYTSACPGHGALLHQGDYSWTGTQPGDKQDMVCWGLWGLREQRSLRGPRG